MTSQIYLFRIFYLVIEITTQVARVVGTSIYYSVALVKNRHLRVERLYETALAAFIDQIRMARYFPTSSLPPIMPLHYLWPILRIHCRLRHCRYTQLVMLQSHQLRAFGTLVRILHFKSTYMHRALLFLYVCYFITL